MVSSSFYRNQFFTVLNYNIRVFNNSNAHLCILLLKTHYDGVLEQYIYFGKHVIYI